MVHYQRERATGIAVELGILVGHASHRGQVRKTNEDNYCILLPPAVAEGMDALLAVADGMGGHQAGEVASSYVVQTLADLFSSLDYRQWVDYSPQHEDYYVAVLKEVLERLNEGLFSTASTQPSLRGMGTTATAALLSGGRLFIGHVGDSRAYLLSNGEMKQLTLDHSWVAEQVRNGRMTSQEAESHPQKNILTRCLGNGLLVRVDRFSQPVHPGDWLILCSDGLSNMVRDEEITQAIQSQADPQQACDQLLELANQRGGPDNITIVIARFVDQAVKSNLPAGRVLGHIPRVDQAAITQKIMRRTLDRKRKRRPKGALIAGMIIASLIAGAGMMAIVVARFPQYFLGGLNGVPLALWGVLALLVICVAALLVIGIQILRR